MSRLKQREYLPLIMFEAWLCVLQELIFNVTGMGVAGGGGGLGHAGLSFHLVPGHQGHPTHINQFIPSYQPWMEKFKFDHDK